MDLSWLQKFSGGLDLIPIGIAIAGGIMAMRLPKADTIEARLGNALALVCFIALPIAQIGWISSVIRGVPALGSVMDNVWTIYNFASLSAIMLFQHGRKT
jgi:hypothetical protein